MSGDGRLDGFRDISAGEGGARAEDVEARVEAGERWQAVDETERTEPTVVVSFETTADKLRFIHGDNDLDQLSFKKDGLAVVRDVNGLPVVGDEATWNPNPAALSLFGGEEIARGQFTAQDPEVADSPNLEHWRKLGFPRFELAGSRIILRVRCGTVERRDAFLARHGIQAAKTTRDVVSGWWPPRPQEDLVSVRFNGNLGPRYPVYVPSRARYKTPMTIRALQYDRVPFRVVVVAEEAEEYARVIGDAQLLVLPSSEFKLLETRNWIRDHAEAEGYQRHWQIDDNLNGGLEGFHAFRRLWRGRRLPCNAGTALRVCEDLSDQFSNVGVSGLNYQMFVPAETPTPFYRNVHVYSITLVNHAMPARWRLRYNDDTDLCLQALDSGWATILLNAFMANKSRTMTVRGGNTDALYQGDGRLVMARSLEECWPGTVSTRWRYGRAQHVVRWDRFRDVPLTPSDDPVTTYGDYALQLEALRQVESPVLQGFLDEEVSGQTTLWA